MSGLRIGFQHSGRTGLMRLVAPFSSWVDRSPYSHTELQLPDGTCCTALPGKGVVMRKVDLNPKNFDFLPLPGHLEPRIRDWYAEHEGEGYDWLGNVRFLTPLISEERKHWFCSESHMAAIGVPEPWRFGPGGTYNLIKWSFPS